MAYVQRLSTRRKNSTAHCASYQRRLIKQIKRDTHSLRWVERYAASGEGRFNVAAAVPKRLHQTLAPPPPPRERGNDHTHFEPCAKPDAQLFPAPPPSLGMYTFSGLYTLRYSDLLIRSITGTSSCRGLGEWVSELSAGTNERTNVYAALHLN